MNGTGHSRFGMYLARRFVKRRRVDFLFLRQMAFIQHMRGILPL